MEWLSLITAHPVALASLLAWLKAQERACSEFALDVESKDIPMLKGKRDAFRDMHAYVQNNLLLMQRAQFLADQRNTPHADLALPST